MLIPHFEGVEFDAFLTYNGSYCYDHEGTLYSNCIPSKDIERIIKNADKMGKPVALATKDRMAANGKDQDLIDYYAFGNAEVDVAEDFEDIKKEKVVKEVKADGFRPGKMPKNIFIQRFGWASLYNEAIQYAFEETYPLALQQTKVYPTAEPKVDLDFASLEKGKSFTYTAEVDVWPEVHLGEYKGLKVKPLSTRVTKKDVEAEIKHMLESKVENVIKDGPAENGDTVVIDFEGFVDGVPFEGGKAENYQLELGSKAFIPGFEDQLIGAKSEQDVEVNVTFPKDYHASLAGKAALFKVKVHEIKTKEKRELDQDFFDDLALDGVNDEKSLKEEVKKNILAQKEMENENIYIDKLLSEVAKNVEVDIPEGMIEEETTRLLKRAEQSMMMQGLNLDLYYKITGSKEEDLRNQLKDEAYQNVLYRLMLEEIVKLEKIEVSEEDAKKEAKELADKYQMEEEDFLKEFGGLEMVQYDLEMRRTIERLKELNK